MSDFSERIVVNAPFDQAARHLATYIADHAADDGKTVRIRLQLPARVIGKTVIATLHPLRSIADARPTYSVEWEPEGGGPFPSFAGALAVDDVDAGRFRLILAGHYDAPLGAPGEMFDATVGSWIARASARELLRTIARYIETSARTV